MEFHIAKSFITKEVSVEDDKKDENEDAMDKGCLIILACILGFIASWWFWVWVLPLFDLFILVYAGWKIWRASIENKKKVLISIGVVMCVGVFSWCIVLCPWILPIAIIASFWVVKTIKEHELKRHIVEKEKQREAEAMRHAAEVEAEWRAAEAEAEAERRAVEAKVEAQLRAAKQYAELARRQWERWLSNKCREVELWVSSAHVILDTNVWMAPSPQAGLRCPAFTISESYECSNMEDWKKIVEKNPGYALIYILRLLNGNSVKVEVPGAQLDELHNICRKNKDNPKSLNRKAARVAMNRILDLQKKNNIEIRRVTSMPDGFAYLDKELVDFVKEINNRSDMLKPLRIITFDKDLLIRLRAAASSCNIGMVQIFDKEDLKGFLLHPQEDFR
jgi:hypothetical protein